LEIVVLYPINYHLGKFFSATAIFVVLAFINTFAGSLVWQILSSLVGLILIVLVYSNEVRYVLDLVVDELRRVKNKASKKA